MLKYGTKEITYECKTAHKGFAVFSEIYYPEGWVCTIDGKEVPYTRVNYVLRGLEIPAGKHKIVWKFEPTSYGKGTTYAYLGSWLIILLVLGLGAFELRKSSQEDLDVKKDAVDKA